MNSLKYTMLKRLLINSLSSMKELEISENNK